MIIQRRSFLLGLGAAIAAPAIVRVSSLMPVRSPLILGNPAIIGWNDDGLRVGDAIRFSTTGILPEGLAEGALYYVCGPLEGNQFFIEGSPTPFFTKLSIINRTGGGG